MFAPSKLYAVDPEYKTFFSSNIFRLIVIEIR